MARPRSFTDEQMLDAGLAVVARVGKAADVEATARELGVSAGSVYYRAGSRHALLTRLWLRSLARFHADLTARVEAADAVGSDPLVAAALAVVGFCRNHRADARALTLFHWEALLADPPPGLEDQVRAANDGLFALMGAYATRRYGAVDERVREGVTIAVQLTAYAIVRPRLDEPDRDIPAWYDDVVAAGAAAMLAALD